MSSVIVKNIVKGSISKVKAELTHYLRLVRHGSTVIVTDRDRPVAKIIPFDSQDKIVTRTALHSVADAMKIVAAEYSVASKPANEFLESLLEDRKKGRR